MKSYSVSLLAGALVAAGLAHQVHAADAAGGEEATLEEVIVTAEKRETNLQKTAISVAVISGEELAEENKTRMDEILEGTPGVQIQEGPGGFIANIRGVTNNQGGTADYPTSMYNDGVYTQVEIENRGAFFDLNRVEVLRGPQGTLYGGNALGGSVNFISNDPDLTRYTASAGFTVGNYNLVSTQGVVNAPLGSSWALRVAGATENRDGYLSSGQDDSVYSAGRVKLRYNPSEALNLVLSAVYTKVGGEGGGTVAAPLAPATLDDRDDPWANSVTVTPKTDARMVSYRAHLDADVGIGTLTYIPAYTDVKQNQLSAAFGPTALAVFHHMRSTQELRLSSLADSAIQWTGGLYYLHYNTPFAIESPDGTTLIQGQVYNKMTQKAVFGQATFPVADALRFTAGARYSKGDGSRLGSGASAGQTGQVGFSKTTWKAGLEYDLTPTSMLYGNVSTGFRAGGIQNTLQTGSSSELSSFPPEEMTSFALGSKNRFWNDRAQVNAEFFYYDFQNYQVSDTAVIGGVNVPESFDAQNVKEYGGELETQFVLTENDRLEASVAWLHAKFGVQDNDTFDISNTDLDHAPQWNLRAAYDHSWRFASNALLTASADANYVSSQKVNYSGLVTAVYGESPAHTLVNATLKYDSPDQLWNVSAYVRNITNYAVINAVSSFGTANIGAPRTFGISAAIKLDVEK
ncbi:MAG: TonB-dependent receptor [Steroidobacteraceae bacterium]